MNYIQEQLDTLTTQYNFDIPIELEDYIGQLLADAIISSRMDSSLYQEAADYLELETN